VKTACPPRRKRLLMIVGLRVDVDTLRGTRTGVVNLLRQLSAHDIQATFFFSVGPDNMGRHIWRLMRPGFLVKMLRSRAPNLYGWDIVLKGTFWPGAYIGRRLAHVIQATHTAGHEVGLHAWDHYAWQAGLDRMGAEAIRRSLVKGVETLSGILGRPPNCSAVAGWKCNEQVLLEKNRFNFDYNSDCRGQNIFRPVVDRTQCTPQVPVTLPTYDELIGRHGITDINYNRHMLTLLKPHGLNVLTIHAEVEGIARASLFERFLKQAEASGVRFRPLGALVPKGVELAPGKVRKGEVPGRDGWVAVQDEGEMNNTLIESELDKDLSP
jgi:undecaprenyl phosphate-alpha-L-ara4FN deformylase